MPRKCQQKQTSSTSTPRKASNRRQQPTTTEQPSTSADNTSRDNEPDYVDLAELLLPRSRRSKPLSARLVSLLQRISEKAHEVKQHEREFLEEARKIYKLESNFLPGIVLQSPQFSQLADRLLLRSEAFDTASAAGTSRRQKRQAAAQSETDSITSSEDRFEERVAEYLRRQAAANSTVSPADRLYSASEPWTLKRITAEMSDEAAEAAPPPSEPSTIPVDFNRASELPSIVEEEEETSDAGPPPRARAAASAAKSRMARKTRETTPTVLSQRRPSRQSVKPTPISSAAPSPKRMRGSVEPSTSRAVEQRVKTQQKAPSSRDRMKRAATSEPTDMRITRARRSEVVKRSLV